MIRKIRSGAFICILFLVASCYKDPSKQPLLPFISIDKTSLETFEYQAGASQTVTLTVNRDWKIECDADWLSFDPESGKVEAGVETDISISVTALTNDIGNKRDARVRFKIDALYADLQVSQNYNPDAPPTLIYYNGFGKDLAGLDNPSITTTNIWREEQGASEPYLSYYKTSGTLSVRNSSTSNSSLGAGMDFYQNASGNNHLFFGTDAPSLTIAEMPIHNAISSLTISFGVFHIDGTRVSETDFLVYISKDGTSWIPLKYEVISEYSEPKWCLCEKEIFFEKTSFEKLYLKFAPKTASKYRVDDITVKTDKYQPEFAASDWVNWTEGAVSLDLGTKVDADS